MRFNDRSELQRSLDVSAAFIAVNCYISDTVHTRVIGRLERHIARRGRHRSEPAVNREDATMIL